MAPLDEGLYGMASEERNENLEFLRGKAEIREKRL